MTPYELKDKVESTRSTSKFFCRENMKFAGDTMRNYGVGRATIQTWTDPEPIEVWELYRKKPVKCGLMNSAYFRKETFEQTFSKQEEA